MFLPSKNLYRQCVWYQMQYILHFPFQWGAVSSTVIITLTTHSKGHYSWYSHYTFPCVTAQLVKTEDPSVRKKMFSYWAWNTLWYVKSSMRYVRKTPQIQNHAEKYLFIQDIQQQFSEIPKHQYLSPTFSRKYSPLHKDWSEMNRTMLKGDLHLALSDSFPISL